MEEDKALSIDKFLSYGGQIVDLRTPKEFTQGHILGAINVPIFSDQERKEVGKVFKLQGPFKATQLGLKYTGPKLSDLVTKLKETKKKPICVYCGRGGMRSQSMIWLLNFCRIPAFFLRKGYRDYRRWVLESFSKDYDLHLLQSFLGSMNIDPKQILKKKKNQFLDLEEIAQFSQYDFSVSESKSQPTSEHFENLLAHELRQLNSKEPIWLSHVGKSLGDCKIPPPFLKQFRSSSLFLIKDERLERVGYLQNAIAKHTQKDLVHIFTALKKKLGPLRHKQILSALEKEQNEDVAESLIDHFDKVTFFHLKKHRGHISSFEI